MNYTKGKLYLKQISENESRWPGVELKLRHRHLQSPGNHGNDLTDTTLGQVC